MPSIEEPESLQPPPLRSGRPPGLPKTGGRRPGSKNKRTLEVEQLFRPMGRRIKRKLREIMDDPEVDPDTRVKAMQIMLAYGFGRPVERRELSGAGGSPLAPSSVHNTMVLTESLADVTARVLARRRAEIEAEQRP